MPDIVLKRADVATLTISGLTGADGVTPATFATGDVLRWVAKRYAGQADADALISKVSPVGITFTDGQSTALIHLVPADFANVPYRDTAFRWDLQVALLGSAVNVVTLDSGDGLIEADLARNP